MMAVPVLFIGGPLDGGGAMMTDARPRYSCLRTPHLPRFNVIDDREIFGGEYEIVHYWLMPLRGEREERFVYIVEGMTLDDALKALMENYHPKKSEAQDERPRRAAGVDPPPPA